MLLLFCFAIVMMFEKTIQIASSKVPDIQCGTPIDETAAFIDFSNPESKRSGDFHCFCMNMANDQGYSSLIDFRFNLAPAEEAGDYCYDWMLSFGAITTATSMIPGIIAIINIIVEIFIGFASSCRRPITETKNVTDAIFGVTFIQFINLGLVIVFANINFKFSSENYSFLRILDGKFEDFSSSWY